MQNIIKHSKKWINHNNKYKDVNRHEGELDASAFNAKILTSLLAYESHYLKFSKQYLIGFEIEFYIKEDTVNNFIEKLCLLIPKEKMIIENIDEVLPSDGKQFFLIQDRTGKPKKGYRSLELISPILDSKLIPYYLENIIKLLASSDTYTDHNLGMHMHISVPHSHPISPISLLYFLHKHEVFNWENRQYVRDIIEQFFSYKKTNWKFIYEDIIRKCYNINFFYFEQDNRIEYRAPGGENYLQESHKIFDSFFSILQAYEDTFSTPDEEIMDLIQKEFKIDKNIIDLSSLSYKELLTKEIHDLWI